MKVPKLTSGIAVTLLTLSASAFGAPGDMVQTTTKAIQVVDVQNDGGGATYYFRADGGWQVPNCSGVTHAYVREDAPGAKAILAAALTARASGTPITFTGICGDAAGNTSYLQIRYTSL